MVDETEAIFPSNGLGQRKLSLIPIAKIQSHVDTFFLYILGKVRGYVICGCC